VGSVADAMHNVLTDEKLRTWLITKGKMQAEKFSWKQTAAETLKVFKNVLSH